MVKVNKHTKHQQKQRQAKSGTGGQGYGFFKKYGTQLLLAVILAVTLAVYFPALRHQFTSWDDPVYVVNNPFVRDLTAEGIGNMFTRTIAQNYHPLTILSLALNYGVSELNPASYLLVNILLHLVNTLLVFWFSFLVLDRRKLPALFVAALFALHPMHVESVAWVSERKDLLYTLFFVSGLVCWIRYTADRKKAFYVYSLVLFVLSGLSKPSAIVFPLVLFLIDYFHGRKITPATLLEKVPFLLISILVGMATLNAQTVSAEVGFQNYTFIQRVLFASYGLFSYVMKLVFPFHLSALHPFPVADHSLALPWLYFAAPLFNLALIAGVIYSLRFTKTLLFGYLFYFLNVMLTLQFMQVGRAVISERYTYLAYVGLFIAGAWLIFRVADRRKNMAGWLYTGMIVLTGTMAVLAAGRVKVWENTETLWNDIIAKYPQEPSAYSNRGYYYLNNGMLDLALADYNRVLELEPANVEALNNRGSAYRQQGLTGQALADYSRAVAIDSTYYQAWSGRGNVYLGLGKLDSALSDFNRAIRIKPSFAMAYGNRGGVYFRMGDLDRALGDCSKAIDLDPANADSYLNRGVVYSARQNWEAAITDLSRYLEMKPDQGMAYRYRGMAYRGAGNQDAARGDFEKARSLGTDVSDLLR